MIDYGPLWDTMQKKGVSTYSLINQHNINPRTINNLKHNKGITTDTLERLCRILECTPNEVLEFKD